MDMFSIKPMLLDSKDEPFDDGNYLFEFKFDGVRMLSYCTGGIATLINRNGNVRTHRYPEIAAELMQICDDCVLDGEIIAVDGKGEQSFKLVMERDASAVPDRSINVFYIVFDILYKSGNDITSLPLRERKQILHAVLDGGRGRIKEADFFTGCGRALFSAAESGNFEGIVAKRADSKYLSGRRSPDWLKIKVSKQAKVFIGGIFIKTGVSLCMGEYTEDGLKYVGNVGSGFTERKWGEVIERLSEFKTSTSPFYNFDAKGVTFLRPVFIANIKYMERTESGSFRHPVILEVKREEKGYGINAGRTASPLEAP